ncbi:MAG: hypothetical protein U5L74_05755 [Ideonella sp.]|nr:hypothetical protein [Ideonella sp.]
MKLYSPHDHSSKAWRYAVASMVISALTVPTLFLMVTIPLLPAIGMILAFKAGKHDRRGRRIPGRGVSLLFILPLGFAILVFCGCLAVVNYGYKA